MSCRGADTKRLDEKTGAAHSELAFQALARAGAVEVEALAMPVRELEPPLRATWNPRLPCHAQFIVPSEQIEEPANQGSSPHLCEG